MTFAAPACFERAGIDVALMTDSPVIPEQYLAVEAAICVRNGLSEEGALIGMLVGVVLLVATSVVTNRFILLPMYAKFAGMEGIIAMADNPSITSLTTLFIYGVIPFNVVKGLALSLVTFILYKPLSPLLHDR